MAAHKHESRIASLLRGVGTLCFLYPWQIIAASVILAVLCGLYTHFRLQLSTERSDLIGRAEKHNLRYIEFLKEFGQQGQIVVVAESASAEKNRQFVEALVARLRHSPELFPSILYKFDLAFFGEHALQFIPEKDLQALATALRDFRPSLEKFLSANDFHSLFRSINREFLTAGESEEEGRRLLQSLPVLRRIVEQISNSLEARDPSLAPEIAMLIDEPEVVLREFYLSLDHGKIFIVAIRWTPQTSDLTPGSVAIDTVKALVDDLRDDYPGFNVGVTGDPVLEYDEMNSAATSMKRASWISLLLVAALYFYSFREFLHPIKIVFTLTIAIGWTFGFTTLAIGHLNILTITFVPILIGLGEDHGVHILSRFEEEIARGTTRREAIETAMAQAGVGVLTGALTMAGAFFAITLTNFKGIQEMGLITGAGLLLSCVAMMTMLPALLALEHGRLNRLRFSRREQNLGKSRAAMEKEFLKFPKLTLMLAMGVTLVSVVFIPRVTFDYNLLKMQSSKLDSVIYEHKLLAAGEHATLFAVTDVPKQGNVRDLSEAQRLDEARQLTRAFREQGDVVGDARSVADFLDGNFTAKMDLIRQVKTDLSGLPLAANPAHRPDVNALRQSLGTLSALMDIAMKELEKANENAAALEAKRLISTLDHLVVQLRDPLRTAIIAEKLAEFQRAFFYQLRRTLELIRDQNDTRPIGVTDVPRELREMFVSPNGRFLIQVFPKKEIWEREPLHEFLRGTRSVDPDITGVPVQIYEYTSVLKRSYVTASLYALAAVMVLAALHFRSWRTVLVSLVPLGVGVLWMLGVMGLFKVPFNPANIMTLPLVLGYGVVNGIQMLHRAREESSAQLFSKSTGKAVLLTSLTTLAGFGSLVVATHPGIVSLGIVMSIGLVTCLISSIVLIPVLLSFFEKKGWKI